MSPKRDVDSGTWEAQFGFRGVLKARSQKFPHEGVVGRRALRWEHGDGDGWSKAGGSEGSAPPERPQGHTLWFSTL